MQNMMRILKNPLFLYIKTERLNLSSAKNTVLLNSALVKWVKQYSTVEAGDGEPLTAKQIKELQKRNVQLEEENLILKKAIAIFMPHSNKD